MPPDIFHENAIILTGASSGIGRELAKLLAAQGAWLALAARSVDKLDMVAGECRERGGRVLVVPTDVSEEAQCKALVEKAAAEFGRIDTLINNAGMSMWALFEDMQTLEPFERLMHINYLGAVYCAHYALPYLKESKGRLVGVASLTGLTGVPTRSGYAASKHALRGFFDTLRIELLGSGVSVTMIYPDFVQTETRMKAWGADGQPLQRSPVREGNVMDVETAGRMILKTIEKRKRELIMSRRGRLGMWAKLIAPGLVDRIALRAIRRGQ
jgi:short-subunit dehydrogenase